MVDIDHLYVSSLSIRHTPTGALMTKIEMNAQDLELVTVEDKKKIELILSASFGGSFEIVRTDAAPHIHSMEIGLRMDDFLASPVCTAACNVAQATATAACSTLGDPILIAACAAAAAEAGKYCRSKCKPPA